MQRGRKSAVSLTVIGPGGIETIRRPEPPQKLVPAAAKVWISIVSSLPADWFGGETHHLLAEYCRVIVHSDYVWGMIEELWASPDFDMDEYERLLKIHERESRLIASLSVKLRISPSASYSKEKNRQIEHQRGWQARNPR